MTTPVLEIELTYRDEASYAARMRFVRPEDDAASEAEAFPIRFDGEALAAAAADPARYGLVLGKALLGDPTLSPIVVRARSGAGEGPLRIRLSIDSWSLRLHRLRWETLRDPVDGRSLVMDQKVWFSRHLGSGDMRPIRLRSGANLKVLVAVASPSDLDAYKPGGKTLPPIEHEAEAAMVRQALAAAPKGRVATVDVCAARLSELKTRLRDGVDILYLACHGLLIADEPRLLFEGADGKAEIVSGADLVAEFDRLLKPPRLVVLASCQSAGGANDTRPDDAGKFAAGLGPRLARNGIPAVLAMLGDVYVETVQAFIPVFLAHLMQDGQIDRADRGEELRLGPTRLLGTRALHAPGRRPALVFRRRPRRRFDPVVAGPDTTDQERALRTRHRLGASRALCRHITGRGELAREAESLPALTFALRRADAGHTVPQHHQYTWLYN